MAGDDLKQVLKDTGVLSASRLVDIGCQVAAALNHAHDRDLVHRDVKPGNILTTVSGEVKLTDFGIAQALGASTLTRTGAVLGTPQYMSPEQVGGHPCTPASDIYSLGVVLYEMAVGRPPFEAESPLAILRMHVNDAPLPARQRNPHLLGSIEHIILRTLAKIPSDRYPSGEELAAALRRAVVSSEESQYAGGPSDRTRPWPPTEQLPNQTEDLATESDSSHAGTRGETRDAAPARRDKTASTYLPARYEPSRAYFTAPQVEGTMLGVSARTGALLVYCRRSWRGRTIRTYLQGGEEDVRANVVERQVDGQPTFVAVFPRLRPGLYRVIPSYSGNRIVNEILVGAVSVLFHCPDVEVTVSSDSVMEVDWR